MVGVLLQMINENSPTAEREPYMLPTRKADAAGASGYDGRTFPSSSIQGQLQGPPSCSQRAAQTVVV